MSIYRRDRNDFRESNVNEGQSIFDNVKFIEDVKITNESVLLENVTIGGYKFHLLMQSEDHNPRFKMIEPQRYSGGSIGIKYCHKGEKPK